MLNKICLKDGVGLVNIVRSDEQTKILKDIGAKYVVDSSKPTFMEDLVAAVSATGATLGFDATGGGKLAGQILQAMEISLSSKPGAYSRYGSSVHKQVYVYGRLSLEPLILTGAYGLAWGVGGFLLTPFLQKIGPAEAQKLRERVAAELKTTFASHYTKTISLREALDPEMIRTYNRKATGEKYLINPSL
jgi:NADPH:quinone reductase-like Zn-dependent oxidoreductase